MKGSFVVAPWNTSGFNSVILQGLCSKFEWLQRKKNKLPAVICHRSIVFHATKIN